MGRRIYIVLATLMLVGCGESRFEKAFKLINEECGPKYDGQLTIATRSGTWGQHAEISCALPAGASLPNE